MPTQHDVAKLAGVSTATVSRVVNQNGAVTNAARKRVEDAIEALRYVPHAGARALALQRSGTLGAIIPTLNNAIFAEGINAFERCAQSLGYTFILALSHNEPRLHSDLVVRMIERGVDGLLLVGNEHSEAVFDRLENARVRHVCTWAYREQARAPNVGFDNATAMHGVVDHLIDLGHSRFGMLAGLCEGNDRASERIKGVTDRLEHHGLRISQNCIMQVDYSISASRKALSALTKQNVSAIICGNDVIAQGALLEALHRGMSVPDDLSITGFDDLELSAELSPSLTSVNVYAQAMGEAAARALVSAVESDGEVLSQCLPTELVIRQTTGRCNAP